MVSIVLQVELPEGYALSSLQHNRYGKNQVLTWSVTVCRPREEFPYGTCFGVGQDVNLERAFALAYEDSKWKFETGHFISRVVWEQMEREKNTASKAVRTDLPSAKDFF